MWRPGNTEKLCPLSVPDSRRKQSLERRNIIRAHHQALWTLSFEAPMASEWCSKTAETSLPNKGHRKEWRLQSGPHATEQRAASASGGPQLSGGEQLSLLKSGKNVVLPANPKYPQCLSPVWSHRQRPMRPFSLSPGFFLAPLYLLSLSQSCLQAWNQHTCLTCV